MSNGDAPSYVSLVAKRSGVLAVVVGSATVLAACGGSSVSVPTSSGSVQVHSNSNGSKVTVHSKKGSATFSGSNQLPTNFPSGTPLPPGIRLTSSIATKEPGKSGFLLTYSFNGSFAHEIDAYNRELSAHGYHKSSGLTYAGGATELWKSTAGSIAIMGTAGTGGSKSALLVTVTSKATD